jgi:ADP-ribosyl-[dinitrogen reductase] hydrolase
MRSACPGKAPNANTGTTPSQIKQLPAHEGWPRGATSDDTALTLLVARHLADRDGDGDPAAFLADLAEQAPAIRGLGPTTTAAIKQFRRGDEPAAAPARATNGAAMRALPIGWVLPHDHAERRRQVTITMSRATHADPAAQVAACVIAACASWTQTQVALRDGLLVGVYPRLAEFTAGDNPGGMA